MRDAHGNRIRAPETPTTIHPPLTHATAADQSGVIAILAGFALGLLLLSTLTRLYARQRAAAHRGDEHAFYVAVATGAAEVGVALYLVSCGLGRSAALLTAAEAARLEKGDRAATALYIVTLALSKASCGIVVVLLTPFARQRRVAWGLVGAAGVWCVTGVFVDAFACRGALGRCAGFMARWIYISVFDMLLELALVASSVYMVWGRSMSRSAKWAVVGGFSCRLPNVAITLTRLIFLATPASTSAVYVARSQAAMQLAVGYTVVACVIPYLRPLMQSYESDGSGYGKHDATFNLSDKSRGSRGSRGSKGSSSNCGSGDVESKGKGKAVDVELNDVSRFLSPETPGLARFKSTETVERAERQVVSA